CFVFLCSPPHLSRLSFPTRRSSDLSTSTPVSGRRCPPISKPRGRCVQVGFDPRAEPGALRSADRLLDPHLHASRDRLPARHLRRSEEHTSELQSPDHLVCRLLLEKK